MPWNRPATPCAPADESDAIKYDDGGSGLLDACRTRFMSSDCEIACDVRHTVWVKRADGTRSVGLPPWTVRRRSVDELLDGVETRLGLTAGVR